MHLPVELPLARREHLAIGPRRFCQHGEAAALRRAMFGKRRPDPHSVRPDRAASQGLRFINRMAPSSNQVHHVAASVTVSFKV